MARPYWKAGHVKQAADLPYKLKKGKAYFIDAEGWIAIDHGDNRGIQIYGNKEGIQGPTGDLILQMRAQLHDLLEKFSAVLEDSAENDSSVQRQIDSLSFTAIKNALDSVKAHNRRKAEIQNEANLRTEGDLHLQQEIDALSELEAQNNENLQTQIDGLKENDSQLQYQSDSLARAGLDNAVNIHNEAVQRRKEFQETAGRIENIQRVNTQQDARLDALDNDVTGIHESINNLADDDSQLQYQSDSLARAGLDNAVNIHNEAVQRRKEFQETAGRIENIQRVNTQQDARLDALDNDVTGIHESINNLADDDSRLQAQSDSLARAGLDNALNIHNEAEIRRRELSDTQKQLDSIQENGNNESSALMQFVNSLAESSMLNNSNLHEALERRKKMLTQEIFNRIEQDNLLQTQIDFLVRAVFYLILNNNYSHEKIFNEINEIKQAINAYSEEINYKGAKIASSNEITNMLSDVLSGSNNGEISISEIPEEVQGEITTQSELNAMLDEIFPNRIRS